MRPFKFFFALSIGIVLLFFVARVLIIAFVIAALMSIPFFIARKIRKMARRRNTYRYDEADDFDLFPFDEDENDRLILNWEREYDPVRKARIIRVQ